MNGNDRSMRINVAETKNKLPESIKPVENGESVTTCCRGLPSLDSGAGEPKSGTLSGRIEIHAPDWWKPLSENEVAAFLDGRY